MSEETIFSEVDEELRSERMRNLWRRFAPYVIGAAVAVVLLVAINEGWAWWQKSNAARSSDAFYAAVDLIDQGDIEGAQAALTALEADGSGGYPLLAQFRQATILVSEGKTDDAAALYDGLANTLSEPRMRELAFLSSAYALVDKGDVDAVQSRVAGLLVDGHPMRANASEALGLTQYAAGDLDAARATFATILEAGVGTSDIQGRMQVYLAQLIAEGAAVPEVIADAQSTDTTEVAQ